MIAPVTPPPIPADAGPLVLFGGTFDPVHLAHARVAAVARDRLVPGAWLVFVPAAANPLKPGSVRAPEPARVEMLRAAIRDIPRAAVWTDEIDRGPPSYWIDTLRRLRSVVGGAAPIHFLIGADQAAQFHRWKDYRQVLALASPIVLARPPLSRWEDLEAELKGAGAWSAADLRLWRTAFFDDLVIDLSATRIRAAIAAGDRSIASVLDPAVLRIIDHHGLYRDP